MIRLSYIPCVDYLPDHRMWPIMSPDACADIFPVKWWLDRWLILEATYPYGVSNEGRFMIRCAIYGLNFKLAPILIAIPDEWLQRKLIHYLSICDSRGFCCVIKMNRFYRKNGEYLYHVDVKPISFDQM